MISQSTHDTSTEGSTVRQIPTAQCHFIQVV